MKLSIKAAFLSMASILPGCALNQQQQQEPIEPVERNVSIRQYVGDILRRSQNDVSDPADFTKIHDNMRQTLRRFDENDDGVISENNPAERQAYETIAELQRIGVGVLIGEEAMKEHVIFDHEEDVLYINPRIEDAREAARAISFYLDKNPEFWSLEARGWAPKNLDNARPNLASDNVDLSPGN